MEVYFKFQTIFFLIAIADWSAASIYEQPIKEPGGNSCYVELMERLVHQNNLTTEARDKMQENDAKASQQREEILNLVTEMHNNKNSSCGQHNNQSPQILTLIQELKTAGENMRILSEQLINITEQRAGMEVEKSDLLSQQSSLETEKTDLVVKLADFQAERTDLLSTIANLTSQLDASRKEIQCLQFRWQGVKNESETCLNTKQEAITTVKNFRIDYDLSQNNTETMDRACYNNELSVVEALLDLGVDIEIPIGETHETCLHYAARQNHVELATLLILRGCKLDPIDLLSWTPLMSSAFQGELEVAKVLVEHGASLNARSSNTNFTALDLANFYNNPEVAQFLKSKGAIEQDDVPNTAL